MSLKQYRIVVVVIIGLLLPLCLGFAAQSFLIGLITFITCFPVLIIVLLSEPKK